MRTQDVFTQMLGDAVKARHFDFIVDHDYANTGIYRAHVELRPALQVRFDFQTSYATFIIDSDKGHEELYAVRFGELREALDKILAHLPPQKMKKRARKRRSKFPQQHTNRLLELGAMTRGLEYGSDEQVDAENEFCTLAETYMDARQLQDFRSYSHRATTDERVDYVLEHFDLQQTSKE